MKKALSLFNNNYEISGKGIEDFTRDIKAFDKATMLITVAPYNIAIFSLLGGKVKRNGEERLNYVSFMPNMCAVSEVNKIMENKKGININSLISAGADDGTINDLIKDGHFFRICIGDKSKVVLPGPKFVSHLCKQLDIGKPSEGINILRDLYLGSELNYNDTETVKILLRTNGKIAKAFSCFTKNFIEVRQTEILKFLELCKKDFGPIEVTSYYISHDQTVVDCTFDITQTRLEGIPIRSGFRFIMSDTGYCGFTLKPIVSIGDTVIPLPGEVIQKRCGLFSFEGLLKEFLSNYNTIMFFSAQSMKDFLISLKMKSALRENLCLIGKESNIRNKVGACKFDKEMDRISEENKSMYYGILQLFRITNRLTNLSNYKKELINGLIGEYFFNKSNL